MCENKQPLLSFFIIKEFLRRFGGSETNRDNDILLANE